MYVEGCNMYIRDIKMSHSDVNLYNYVSQRDIIEFFTDFFRMFAVQY